MQTGNTLVLFDFDGTITHRDSLLQFTRFFVGSRRYLFGMAYLFIPLVKSKLGLLSAQKTKELFLTYFFKGVRLSEFHRKCASYSNTTLPKNIRSQALKAIETHKRLGSQIYIVSASACDWIQPWANQFNINVIATQLEIKDDQLTGKIKGLNCNGPEKVNRLKEIVDLSKFDKIVAYGDSTGDLAMMDLAHEKFYRKF